MVPTPHPRFLLICSKYLEISICAYQLSGTVAVLWHQLLMFFFFAVFTEKSVPSVPSIGSALSQEILPAQANMYMLIAVPLFMIE